MKTIKTIRLSIRQRDGSIQKAAVSSSEEVTQFGVPTVRIGGVELSADRELQTFDQALHDTIEQNRNTLIKLAQN